MKGLKAPDFILLALYIAGTVLSFFFFKPESGDNLTIRYEDKEYAFSLEKDRVFEVEGEIGVNVIEIKDGRFRFIESPCDSKTCVHMGYSDFIVCIPNKVIAERDKGGVDAESR